MLRILLSIASYLKGSKKNFVLNNNLNGLGLLQGNCFLYFTVNTDGPFTKMHEVNELYKGKQSQVSLTRIDPYLMLYAFFDDSV